MASSPKKSKQRGRKTPEESESTAATTTGPAENTTTTTTSNDTSDEEDGNLYVDMVVDMIQPAASESSSGGSAASASAASKGSSKTRGKTSKAKRNSKTPPKGSSSSTKSSESQTEDNPIAPKPKKKKTKRGGKRNNETTSTSSSPSPSPTNEDDRLSPLPERSAIAPPPATTLQRTVTPGAQRVGEGHTIETIPPPTALRAAMSGEPLTPSDARAKRSALSPTARHTPNSRQLHESGITQFSVEDWNDEPMNAPLRMPSTPLITDEDEASSTVPEPTTLRPGRNYTAPGAVRATSAELPPTGPPPPTTTRRGRSEPLFVPPDEESTARDSDAYLIHAQLVEEASASAAAADHNADDNNDDLETAPAEQRRPPSLWGGARSRRGLRDSPSRQEPRLVEAKLFEEDEDDHGRWMRCMSRCSILVILLVVLVVVVGVVAIVLIILLTGGSDGGNDNNNPIQPGENTTIDPTDNTTNPGDGTNNNNNNTDPNSNNPDPSLSVTETFLASLPDATRNDLQVPTSPQSKAFQWIENDPQFENYSLKRQQQRFALASLYYATGGDVGEWRHSDDWLTTTSDPEFNQFAHECNWFTHEDTNVCTEDDSLYASLSLEHNNLEGSLPKELALLNPGGLKRVKLSRDALIGPVPSELSSLTELTTMDLSVNRLSGELPTVLPPSLEYLYLAGNANLQGSIPSTWGNMTTLKEVDLRATAVGGSVPPEVCALIDQNGLVLTLDCNAITCDCACECQTSQLFFPPGLNTLYSLLPDYSQQALTSTDTAQSQAFEWMRTDPELDDWPDFRLVQRFAMATFYYALDGPNWGDQGDSPWLSYELQECDWFSDVDPFLGSCLFEDDRLTDLQLISIGLTHELPPEIGLLTDLLSIRLDDNFISGSLPTTIGNLVNLYGLWIRFNFLSGELPTELGLLAQLEDLDLHDNHLEGELNAAGWLGNLKELRWLDLSENFFTGIIPEMVGNLTKLEYLYLGGNEFAGGEIPTSFLQHQLLDYLSLASMNITGEISAEQWQAWSGLVFIDLGLNGLSGQIATDIGRLRAATYIDLYNNEFTGPIPTEMGELESLETLYLEGNNFQGNIPTQLAQITGLEILHVYENDLQGTVPEEICERVRNHDLELRVDCELLHCPEECDCECGPPEDDDDDDDSNDETRSPVSSPVSPFTPTTPTTPIGF